MSQTSVGVDFTLETVQYKFATIIGELCGKPSILSQFAVWLDLRLAEYKLKGSICLDCSGLKPEPDWLHGLRQPVTVSTDTHANEYSQANVQSHHPESQHISPFPVSRSSALQVHEQQYPNMPDGETTQFQDTDIKQQFNYSGHSVSNEVIPLSFHPNLSHKSRQHRNKYLAKRQSISVERGPSTPAKQSKSVVSLDTDDSNLNEPNPLNSSYTSRMTPVSVEKEFPLASSSVSTHSPSLEETHNTSGMFQRAEYLGSKDQGYSDKEDSGLDTDFLKSLGEEADQSSTETEKKDLPERFFMPVDSLEERDNVTEVLRVLGSNLHAEPIKSEPQSCQQTSSVDPLSDPNTPTRRGRLDCMARVYGCARNTVSNVYASVMCFDRWLKTLAENTNQSNSDRKMFEIPPQELDQLLVDFFNSIKKPDGSDYNPNSLRSLRTNLARYLKENSYQYPIVTSEHFFRSQLAFKRRMHDLLEKTIRWSSLSV